MVKHSIASPSRLGVLAITLSLMTGASTIIGLPSAGAGPVVRLSPGAAVKSVSASEVGAVYVANTSTVPGNVSQFGLDSQGSLTPLSPASVASGLIPVQVAVNAKDKSVYVTDFDNTISQYSIDPLTGALSPKTPPAIPAGRVSTGVAVTPDGKSVYVSNDGDNNVSEYNVDPLDGRLSPKSPATIAAGKEPSDVAVSPDGHSVYVSNASDNTVSMYNVDPTTGALSPKTPATVTGGGGPRKVAITPNGRTAYVTNSNSGDNDVSQYDINPSTGVLSAKVPATVPTGIQPYGMVVAPNGKNAYVCNIRDNTVSQYSIDPLTGALSPKTPATVTGGGGPIDVATSPQGNGVYVTNYFSATVSQYDVDGGTGTLSPKSPASVATTGANPEGIASASLPLLPTLTIKTTSLPPGRVRTQYSATLQASGGTPPYGWTIISGALPDGLRLDPHTGMISGTPTEPGIDTFTVQVVDHQLTSQPPTQDTATRVLSITVHQGPLGNIFATTFKDCTVLHVGYNRFVNGTITQWRVTTNGVGTVASGQFSALGGGVLGSKTYHFMDIALGTTLPSEASGIQSHVLFTWANGGRFYATRDPGC
jgi:6-phosphogluconolactonase (cycloisomerase 2 family)